MSEPNLSQVDPDIASLITSRGMGASEMKSIGNWMADVSARPDDEALLTRIAASVRKLCDKFPAPGIGANPSA